MSLFRPVIAAVLSTLCAGCGFGFVSDDELADRLDADNDGWHRRIDCDDNDPSVTLRFWFVDADRDGYGDAAVEKVVTCDWKAGLALEAGDCDDTQPLTHPDAPEICNRIDDDCDGRADESVEAPPVFYNDKDGDSYGDPLDSVATCFQPEGWVTNDLDCDDLNVDTTTALTWYSDTDGDGWGDNRSLLLACVAPEGSVPRAGDCNDNDAAVNPDATEVCDDEKIDEDCDGFSNDDDHSVDLSNGIDTWIDNDGDGLGDAMSPAVRCQVAAAEGWVDNRDDCDDTDPLTGFADCPYITVSAGTTASCAVRGDHNIDCWGEDLIALNSPSGTYIDVAVGLSHACGLSIDGTLQCWGATGLNTFESDERLNAVKIDGSYTCARTDAEDLQCWSGGIEYRIGIADQGFSDFAVGISHSCGLMDDGDGRCLGVCNEGECGVPPGPIDDIAAGREFTCALDGSGGAVCWGDFDNTIPSVDFTDIAAYGRHVCGADSSSVLTCWAASSASSAQDPPQEIMTSWDVGAAHGCGITDPDGQLVCWGDDTYGQASPPRP